MNRAFRNPVRELRGLIELGIKRISIDWGMWPKEWIAVAKNELALSGYHIDRSKDGRYCIYIKEV